MVEAPKEFHPFHFLRHGCSQCPVIINLILKCRIFFIETFDIHILLTSFVCLAQPAAETSFWIPSNCFSEITGKRRSLCTSFQCWRNLCIRRDLKLHPFNGQPVFVTDFDDCFELDDFDTVELVSIDLQSAVAFESICGCLLSQCSCQLLRYFAWTGFWHFSQ